MISLVAMVSTFLSDLVSQNYLLLQSFLKLSGAFISRYGLRILTPILLTINLSATAIVFFYPLEIETRESTVWLHVLALKQGIDIYDHSQVAFVNMNHGPFDPILKLWTAELLPFLESWQVTRIAVFLLPYVFLLVAWELVAGSSPQSRLRALFLGGIGYLFLIVTAKEWLFVGRSDPTAALLLLLLLYASIVFTPKTRTTAALAGFVCGALATAVMFTNWKVAPIAVAVLIFSWWLVVKAKRNALQLGSIYLIACAIVSLALSGLMLYHVSDFNFAVYYDHFFGFFSKTAGWSVDADYRGSLIYFLPSLFDPIGQGTTLMGRGTTLKGGPLLLALVVYTLLPGKSDSTNKAWLFLSGVSLAFCALAYYLNYWGGGSWYFLPFLIILWVFFVVNSPRVSQLRLSLLGIVLLALLGINFQTAVLPTIRRVSTIRAAQAFMAEVRSLQEKGSILSEDTFFFRKRYAGELIDMGDTVSFFAKSAYFSPAFKQTVKRHFAQVSSHPPDYIITGFTESPELRKLIKEKYLLVAQGPHNLTASYSKSSELFRRRS
jgi:hypothetical protein